MSALESPLPLVARFQRMRWTAERQAIDAMQPGDVLTFGQPKYFNVKSSVQRLNEAYDGTRSWSLATLDRSSVVRCLPAGEFAFHAEGAGLRTNDSTTDGARIAATAIQGAAAQPGSLP